MDHKSTGIGCDGMNEALPKRVTKTKLRVVINCNCSLIYPHLNPCKIRHIETAVHCVITVKGFTSRLRAGTSRKKRP